MTVTDDQLREWERLCEEASREPWHVDDPVDFPDQTRVWSEASAWEGTMPLRNARLLAGARTAMPELIAEVRRLRGWRLTIESDPLPLDPAEWRRPPGGLSRAIVTVPTDDGRVERWTFTPIAEPHRRIPPHLKADVEENPSADQ